MNAGMKRLFQEMPIERMVVPPFALLRKLGAHEQKFLARMAEHEAVVGAQVGESLPGVPGHPRQERALTVDDLVVGQRQNEIFEEGVVQPEQDLAVMMAAVKRVLADIIEGVVHPPHVPFVTEAKAARVDRP